MNFFSLFKRKIIYNFKKKILIDNDNFEDKSLDFLLNYYGSDKANIFKHTNARGHGYSIFYNDKLKELKNKKIYILEIGSFSGASAAAFIKYFPNSKVFCFDVNISNFTYKSKNIHVYGLNINNKKKVVKKIHQIFKENKFEKFDLIIDDGSHYLSDILFSVSTFFKYLKEKGLFIIEDFKHPNYYNYNRDVDDILIDDLLDKLKKKILFKSSIIDPESQKYLIETISQIESYKGNLADSDICFIKKK